MRNAKLGRPVFCAPSHGVMSKRPEIPKSSDVPLSFVLFFFFLCLCQRSITSSKFNHNRPLPPPFINFSFLRKEPWLCSRLVFLVSSWVKGDANLPCKLPLYRPVEVGEGRKRGQIKGKKRQECKEKGRSSRAQWAGQFTAASFFSLRPFSFLK